MGDFIPEANVKEKVEQGGKGVRNQIQKKLVDSWRKIQCRYLQFIKGSAP